MLRLIIRLIIALVGIMPLSMIRKVGSGLGWFLGSVVRFRRKIVELQIRRVFLDRGLKTRQECLAMVHGFYRHFGIMILENLKLYSSRKPDFDTWVEVEGEEHLKDAIDRGKGVLILGAHIGNWELAGAVMVRRGFTVATITKTAKSQLGQWLQEHLRQQTGILSYPKKNSIRGIFSGLKNNQVIVLMIDQNMTRNEGVFVDFLGYPACTLPSMITLAERSGAAVIPAAIYREDAPYRHRIVIHPPVQWQSQQENREQAILENTRILTAIVEKMILEKPEQWLWLHKRWRTRPEDEETNPFDYRHPTPL